MAGPGGGLKVEGFGFSGSGGDGLGGAAGVGASSVSAALNNFRSKSPKYDQLTATNATLQSQERNTAQQVEGNVAAAGIGAMGQTAAASAQAAGQTAAAKMQADATKEAAQAQATASMVSSGLGLLGGFLG
jgi:hypothetical protein